MSIVKGSLATLQEHLMVLWKTEISLEVLVESNCAKTVKFLQDYCKCYEVNLPELRNMFDMCVQILHKWKNYVSYTIFDDGKDNVCDFIKAKRDNTTAPYQALGPQASNSSKPPSHSRSTAAVRE